ncbi:MAG: caspase family protein [Rikenellaceae bacterium]
MLSKVGEVLYSKSLLSPTAEQESNSGWRAADQKQSAYYEPTTQYDELSSSFKKSELISVQPSGFCSIGSPSCSNGKVFEFMLNGHIYSKNPYNFSTQRCVKVYVDDVLAKTLPSSDIVIAAATGLYDTKVVAMLPKSLKSNQTIKIEITLDEDLHTFTLEEVKNEKVSRRMLSILPHYPVWREVEIVEEPEPEPVFTEEEKEVAILEVSDITQEVLNGLRGELLLFIDNLKRNKELSRDTQVDVNTELLAEANEEGQIEYNMKVRYDVQVLPQLSSLNVEGGTDDWEPGKFLLKDSKAARYTATLIKKSVEEQLSEYLTPTSKTTIKIIGSTDGSRIRGKMAYNGAEGFGDIIDGTYFVNGSFDYVTITEESGITSNEQLAYLRTLDIKNFMQTQINPFKMGIGEQYYEHYAEVSSEIGAEYRRVAVEITVHNPFAEQYPQIAPKQSENIYERVAEVDSNIPKGQTIDNSAVAVIIGNTNYKTPTGKQGVGLLKMVPYAINDAKTMQDYLTTTIGVKAENIISCYDAEKRDFDEIFGKDKMTPGTLDELVAKVGAKTIYFFYSGHGMPSPYGDGDGYFIGVASNPTDPKMQCSSMNYIYAKMAQIEGVERINVMADACFSGIDMNLETRAFAGGAKIQPKKEDKFVILSAAQSDESALDYKEKKHGIFSYAIFKAMQDKSTSDLNGDGVLSFDELYKYVSNKEGFGVPYWAVEERGEGTRQNPDLIYGKERNLETIIRY